MKPEVQVEQISAVTVALVQQLQTDWLINPDDRLNQSFYRYSLFVTPDRILVFNTVYVFWTRTCTEINQTHRFQQVCYDSARKRF